MIQSIDSSKDVSAVLISSAMMICSGLPCSIISQLIGEAVNSILKIDPDISITSARKIVDSRNYIIHGYDSLDNEILWSIVINHIPKLEKEIRLLLG